MENYKGAACQACDVEYARTHRGQEEDCAIHLLYWYKSTNKILTPEVVRARHVMANMLALISDNKKTVRDAVLAWYLVYSVYLVYLVLILHLGQQEDCDAVIAWYSVYLRHWSTSTNTDSRGAACQPLRLVRAHRGRHSDVC